MNALRLRRRDLILGAAAISGCRHGGGGLPEVVEKSIEELRGIPAKALCDAYLRRIEEIDRNGPQLNSVIEVNPDARRIAAEIDAGKHGRGVLRGVAILVKDNIDTADGMKTTAGSLALLNAPRPKRDAPIVARLREAGALILGKTNLSEWANIRSPRSTSGWSGRGGQTKNPYALDRNTSGSSSGSGAAAAASLCAVAIGTETDGSIVSPASICGLVGIKPTVGLLSGEGIIPISHTQDTAGPMARTVRDAALVLGVMAGRNYMSGCRDANGLAGKRIGVCRQMYQSNPDVTRIAEQAVAALREAGAEIVDPVEFPKFSQFGEAELEVMLYELKADLNAYLAARGDEKIRTLQDVIAFNEANAEREMKYFGQETLIKAQAKGGLNEPAYQEALAKCRRLTREEGIDGVMAKHKLDALFAPTDSPAWPTDWVNGDHFTGGSSSLPAVAGYPHITVPGGFVHGLPVGISLFAGAGAEAALIGMAYAFEQKTKARRAPKYLASVRY